MDEFSRVVGGGIAVGLGVIVACGHAEAVTGNNPISPQTPNAGSYQFVSATGTGTYELVYSAGAAGSICNGGWINSNDGSAHLVTVQLLNSAGTKIGGTAVSVAASAGFTSTTSAVNFMSPAVWPGLPLDSDQNPTITLAPGWEIEAAYATAMSSGTGLNVTVQCADY